MNQSIDKNGVILKHPINIFEIFPKNILNKNNEGFDMGLKWKMVKINCALSKKTKLHRSKL